MNFLGPWTCPYCGTLVYSHQVHQCTPQIPWPGWKRGGVAVVTTDRTAPVQPLTLTIKPPVEALRPEDV